MQGESGPGNGTSAPGEAGVSDILNYIGAAREEPFSYPAISFLISQKPETIMLKRTSFEKDTWAFYLGSFCWSKSAEFWVYEPSASNRDEAFLADTRFTFVEARGVAEKVKTTGRRKKQTSEIDWADLEDYADYIERVYKPLIEANSINGCTNPPPKPCRVSSILRVIKEAKEKKKLEEQTPKIIGRFTI